MQRGRVGWLLVVACLIGSNTKLAQAQLSPGPLSSVHSHLEGLDNCSRCHDPNAAAMGAKCLVCHTGLNARIAERKGLHARPDFSDCVICHVDHLGADYNLIWWKDGIKSFDHNQTGYALGGGHLKIECRQCHRAELIPDTTSLVEGKANPSRTFLGLDTTCTSCHFDEHRGQLKGACTTCHITNAWKPAPGFNHNLTEFVLLGKHITTPCEKCHPRVVTLEPGDPDYLTFGGQKRGKCTDCHEDIHKDRLGRDCERCHTNDNWKQSPTSNFDHSKTRYPLQGRHVPVKCEKCHRPGTPMTGQPFAKCSDCHRDAHNGEFAARADAGACESCHTVDGFVPARFTFADHDKSDYPLRGAHGAVICQSCHPAKDKAGHPVTPRFNGRPTECKACHRDIHDGSGGLANGSRTCTACHTDEQWASMLFDHSTTDYPLTGGHNAAACLQCHHPDTSGSRRVIRFTVGRTCTKCHRDVHRGQFDNRPLTGAIADSTRTCDRCHTTARWIADLFDHNQDSRYVLDGAHIRVPCRKCHVPNTESDSTFIDYRIGVLACRDCHAGDTTKVQEVPR